MSNDTAAMSDLTLEVSPMVVIATGFLTVALASALAFVTNKTNSGR